MPADSLHALVASIYEAALETDRWEPLLRRLLEAVGCRRGTIGLSVDGQPDLSLQTSFELDPDLLRRWDGEFSRFDPFLAQYGGRIGTTGTAVRMYDVVQPEEVRRTDVFRAIYAPMGIDDHLVTVLGHTEGRGSFFAAYRGLTEERFTTHECELHQSLSRHLVLAARIHDRLHALRRAREAREAVVERLPYGLIWLDDDGRVLAMNPAAERLGVPGGALRLRQGRLVAGVSAVQRELERAIAGAIAIATGRGPGSGQVVRIPRPLPARPLAALVFPIPRRSREISFGFEPRDAAAAVALSDPDASPVPARATLQRLFGLTPALARLAAALCSGRTLNEHADECGVTIGTVRQQMKELLARTGARRQADLVRTMLTSVVQLDASPEPPRT